MNRVAEISDAKHSPPYFKNPILNRLCHTNISTIFIVYVPVVSYFIYQSVNHHSLLQCFMGVAIGLFLWTFIEYCVHRFLFHYQFKNERIKYFHSILHLSHHQYTQDSSKYQTLLIVTIPTAIIYYYLFTYLFGANAEPLLAGFYVGYILYEFTHYSTHKYRMNQKISKYIKQHHMHHHYLDYTKNFGVTSPLWDYIFKTKLNTEKAQPRNFTSSD